MGAIHRGVPPELCAILQRLTRAATFVETGTNKGNTALWAAERFDRVWTIEAHDGQYARARARLAPVKNIDVVHGESHVALQAFMAKLQAPAVCWLDAHWSGAGTAGESYQCPVIDEIRAVDCSAIEHVILIDDARMFMRPYALPYDVAHWPALPALFDVLRQRWTDASIVVVDDVIVRVPGRIRDAFIEAVRVLPDTAQALATRSQRWRPLRLLQKKLGGRAT